MQWWASHTFKVTELQSQLPRVRNSQLVDVTQRNKILDQNCKLIFHYLIIIICINVMYQ